MGRNLDLEALKMIFKDQRVHLAIATIKKVSVASDRSFVKCLVEILPEKREVVARMTWPSTGPEAGFYDLPEKNDLVLVGFADGNNDYAFIITRMTSTVDKIPLRSVGGDLVVKSKAGKKAWFTGRLKAFITQGDTVPTENLVLGQQLKTLLIDLLAKVSELSTKCDSLSAEIATHQHPGNLGYPTGQPYTSSQFNNLATQFNGIAADFDDLSSSPVQDEVILSDFAFTEKGT